MRSRDHAVAAMPMTATPTPACASTVPQVDRGSPIARFVATANPPPPRERVITSLKAPRMRKKPSPMPSGASAGPPIVAAYTAMVPTMATPVAR